MKPISVGFMIISGSKLDKFVFFVVVFDLMFFPYVRSLTASISMLVLPLWYIFRSKVIIHDFDIKLSFFLLLLILLSLIKGGLVYSDGFYLRDGSNGDFFSFLPNAVIASYLVLYFIFFKSVIARYSFKIENLLYIYICFVFSLSLLFYLNPVLYFDVRSFWTMYDNVIEVSSIESSMFRFTSTLSDPNNLAAIVVAIMAYFLFSVNKKGFKFLIPVVAITFIIVLASMSTSGLIIFFLILLFYMINELFLDVKKKSDIIKGFLYVFILAASMVILFLYIKDTNIGVVSINRSSENSIDSRLLIWANAFDINKALSSLLIGDGGLPIINGKVINPHNGHLYLIYSYGFIFYILFMIMFFVKPSLSLSKKYIFILPVFLCFTINVGFYELRFSGVFSLLMASVSATFYGRVRKV